MAVSETRTGTKTLRSSSQDFKHATGYPASHFAYVIVGNDDVNAACNTRQFSTCKRRADALPSAA